MAARGTRLAATSKRRREILEAALACFTELGFAATTMEEIRRRSRASTGSIYHHFSGKDELAGALYLEGIQRYQDGLLVALGRHRSAARGIRAIVLYHLGWVEAHHELARYLFQTRRAESVEAVEG